MTKRPHRNHSPAFKAKVGLTAIEGEKSQAEPADQFEYIQLELRVDVIEPGAFAFEFGT
jgi:hypothetical protein